jgi:hypothetical protein
MAQILRYHSYPPSILADHTYTDNDGTCTGRHSISDAGMQPYDWANMPAQITASSSQTQINAVARLIHHCGVSVESDYEADGTGAYA